MDIGVRELRETLSQQLAAVQDGQTVTITSHGKPIARLVPILEQTKLERLIAEGRVLPAQRPKGPPPEPIKTKGSASEFIEEQRR